jgi:hypothetical protein
MGQPGTSHVVKLVVVSSGVILATHTHCIDLEHVQLCSHVMCSAWRERKAESGNLLTTKGCLIYHVEGHDLSHSANQIHPSPALFGTQLEPQIPQYGSNHGGIMILWIPKF